MKTRQERGQKIANNSENIERIDENNYAVKSQTIDGKFYDIIHTDSGWTCSCPDHYFRKICCQHIHSVEISLKIRSAVETKTVLNPIDVDCCNYCNSENIIKKGLRKNKTHSVQVYLCKSCDRKFSVSLGFTKMHASPQVITSAMQLYFTGESLRGVQKFLRLQGIKMSHVSIYNWIKKYTKLMDNYLNTITPQVGERWHADEVWLKVKGDKKYLFAMMDNDTRFWIAQEVADTKFKHNAQSLLKIGKSIAKKIPSEFVTDGLPAYNDAFKKEFAPKNFLHKPSKHIKDVHFRNQLSNNNIQERLNGEFRDREKTFRGLKISDSPAITGIKLHHNFIKPHMSLDGDTPAKRAGIEVNGDNKWLTIIQNASRI